MFRLLTLVFTLLGLSAASIYVPVWLPVKYTAPSFAEEQEQTVATSDGTHAATTDIRPIVTHVPLPKQVKALYMSACVSGTPSFRTKLVAIATSTEVNSLVIDIKDYSGTISFPPNDTDWQYAWTAAECGAADMRDFVSYLHSLGIYVIGRVTVFQDPLLTASHPEWAVKRADRTTVWKDYKGLSFIDVGAHEYWDHLVNLVVDSYNAGFDEINFDYVRYPSDGPMDDIAFTHAESTQYGKNKPANLEAFFAYLTKAIADPARYQVYQHQNTGRATSTPWTSADLFGMTTTNYDDLSIGQVLERTIPYFDFVAPMVYPSHYPDGFHDLGDPNDHPYQVVKYAMSSGVTRVQASTTPMDGLTETRLGTTTPAVYQKPIYSADKLRTWIQDFDYGGDYDATDVRNEIQASYDAGVSSWMIWAPSNIYTTAALQPAE